MGNRYRGSRGGGRAAAVLIPLFLVLLALGLWFGRGFLVPSAAEVTPEPTPEATATPEPTPTPTPMREKPEGQGPLCLRPGGGGPLHGQYHRPH